MKELIFREAKAVMQKPITPQLHGVLNYSTAAATLRAVTGIVAALTDWDRDGASD